MPRSLFCLPCGSVPLLAPSISFENLPLARGRSGSADAGSSDDDALQLLLHHDDRSLPVGKTIDLTETPQALTVRARVSDTVAGNDALTLIHDGVLDGLSVGFYMLGETWSPDRTVRTVTRAELRELSLVNFPAYDNARVLAVRQATEGGPDDDTPVDDESPAEDVDGLLGVRLKLLHVELASRKFCSTPGSYAGISL